jgi:hypothetical protein
MMRPGQLVNDTQKISEGHNWKRWHEIADGVHEALHSPLLVRIPRRYEYYHI